MSFTVEVPGTRVVAEVGRRHGTQEWAYTLWDDHKTEPVARGVIDFHPMRVTPDQVARVAFLLELEYPKS